MGDVVYLNCVTTLDAPVDRVIESSENEEFEEVITIGKYEDGELFVSTSSSERAKVLFLLERAKNMIMSGVD